MERIKEKSYGYSFMIVGIAILIACLIGIIDGTAELKYLLFSLFNGSIFFIIGSFLLNKKAIIKRFKK